MAKRKARLIDQPELKLVLLFVGYGLLSWPVFTRSISGIGELYISLFVLWFVAIVMLYLCRKAR